MFERDECSNEIRLGNSTINLNLHKTSSPLPAVEWYAAEESTGWSPMFLVVLRCPVELDIVNYPAVQSPIPSHSTLLLQFSIPTQVRPALHDYGFGSEHSLVVAPI